MASLAAVLQYLRVLSLPTKRFELFDVRIVRDGEATDSIRQSEALQMMFLAALFQLGFALVRFGANLLSRKILGLGPTLPFPIDPLWSPLILAAALNRPFPRFKLQLMPRTGVAQDPSA